MHQSADDPILKKEIVWQEVLPELEKRIASNVVAQAALRELEQAGCSRRQILERLFMFAAIPAADVQAAKAAFSKRRKSILALSNRLKSIAKVIERSKVDLADMGFEVYSEEQEEVRSYADLLEHLADTSIRDLASARVSARDHNIVFLCKSIERVTGRPHHKEVGELIDAVGRAFDPSWPETHTAEKVGKLIGRWLELRTPSSRKKARTAAK